MHPIEAPAHPIEVPGDTVEGARIMAEKLPAVLARRFPNEDSVPKLVFTDRGKRSAIPSNLRRGGARPGGVEGPGCETFAGGVVYRG